MIRRHAYIWPLCLALLAGCSRTSSEPPPSASATTDPQAHSPAQAVDAFGRRLALPQGFSGGENDEGGYEYSDGQLALLLGRHPRTVDQDLLDVCRERARVLLRLSPDAVVERPCAESSQAVLWSGAAANEGGRVVLRLALVPLAQGDAALGVLLIGPDAKRGHLDQVWRELLQALKSP